MNREQKKAIKKRIESCKYGIKNMKSNIKGRMKSIKEYTERLELLVKRDFEDKEAIKRYKLEILKLK